MNNEIILGIPKSPDSTSNKPYTVTLSYVPSRALVNVVFRGTIVGRFNEFNEYTIKETSDKTWYTLSNEKRKWVANQIKVLLTPDSDLFKLIKIHYYALNLNKMV